MDDVQDEAGVLQTTKNHVWHGYAAADRDASGITLEVIIPELSPALTGQLASATSAQSISLQDYNANPINGTVNTKNSHTCHYRGGDSNRRYPPDVVKGEQVVVTKVGNSDKYYWESAGRDDNLRMKETHRIDVANRTNPTDPNDDAHSYSFELDTKTNQHIRLRTSTGGGEKNIYDLTLDGKNGQLRLSDDVGNAFTIDTASAKVILQNSQQAFMMLKGKDAMFMCPENMTIKAGKQIIMVAPEISHIASDVFAISCAGFGVAAKTSAVINAPAIGLNGATKATPALAINQLRYQQITNGAVGAPYALPTIATATATGTSPANAPDTTPGTAQRFAASWDNMTAAMTIVTDCFNQIQAKTGAPTTQATIAPAVVAAKMPNIQGT